MLVFCNADIDDTICVKRLGAFPNEGLARTGALSFSRIGVTGDDDCAAVISAIVRAPVLGPLEGIRIVLG